MHIATLTCRQWQVDYLLSVCETLVISHGTRFLAVKLMDHFMDKHVVMDYTARSWWHSIVASRYVGTVGFRVASRN